MKLFGLESTREFAERLAGRLELALSSHEEREFGDEEFKIRALESVRGERVALVQTLNSDSRYSASDKLCRLAFFVGSLKDAGAAEVVAVSPYLAFARKDRRTKQRDPITTRYVAAMLEAVGLDMVITADVHNLAAYENAFRCKKENLEAARLFVNHFESIVVSEERVVVLSPDAGGVKRARAFAELFEASHGRPAELAFMEKKRSEGKVTGEAFAGHVDGATVIVIDDLISGGTTMARAARACSRRGASRVCCAATHAVFSRDTATTLGIPEIESVVVTDTVALTPLQSEAFGSKLVVLDSTALFAEALQRIFLQRGAAS